MASRACLLLLMACAASDAFTLQRRSPLRTAASPRTEHRRPVVSASLDQLVVPAAMPSTITLANNDMSLSGSQVAGYFGFLLLLITIPFVGGTMDTFRISKFRQKRQDFIDAIEGEIAALVEDGEPAALETADELRSKLSDVYDEIEAERIEDKKNKYFGMNRYWMQLRNDPEADIEPGDVKANRDRIVPGMDGRGFVPGEMAREELKSQGNRYQRRQGKTGKRKKGKL